MTPLLLLLLLAPGGQQPPSFSVGVEAVYVDVFVTDDDGPVTGLVEADFELREDGRRRQIELVTVDSLPLTTFLVLDTSGSLTGEKLERLQAASRALLAALRPGDRAALVTFDQEIRMRVPPTADTRQLERGVAGILPGGSTALWDALYAGTLLASGPGRALLVLFTDGEDNASWLDSEQLQRVLEESNVLVQAVGIVPPEPARPSGWRTSPPRPSEPVTVRTLRGLAEVTGGRFWPAASPDRLEDSFLAILQAMKTRYVLRFEPDPTRREGLHQLDVRLTRRKGKVHSRKAYFVGPASR